MALFVVNHTGTAQERTIDLSDFTQVGAAIQVLEVLRQHLIDIDCHNKGNARSATAFADWLAKNYFLNLYHEPSTHGIGRHGYFTLLKERCNAVALAKVLKQLDKTLKKLLRYFLATHPEHEVENLKQFAVDLKLDPQAFNECLDSGKYTDIVKTETQNAQALGVSSTPSFLGGNVSR